MIQKTWRGCFSRATAALKKDHPDERKDEEDN